MEEPGSKLELWPLPLPQLKEDLKEDKQMDPYPL